MPFVDYAEARVFFKSLGHLAMLSSLTIEAINKISHDYGDEGHQSVEQGILFTNSFRNLPLL